MFRGQVPSVLLLQWEPWFMEEWQSGESKTHNHLPPSNRPESINDGFSSSYSTFQFPLSYMMLCVRLHRSGWMLENLHPSWCLSSSVSILPGVQWPFSDYQDAHCFVFSLDSSLTTLACITSSKLRFNLVIFFFWLFQEVKIHRSHQHLDLGTELSLFSILNNGYIVMGCSRYAVIFSVNYIIKSQSHFSHQIYMCVYILYMWEMPLWF